MFHYTQVLRFPPLHLLHQGVKGKREHKFADEVLLCNIFSLQHLWTESVSSSTPRIRGLTETKEKRIMALLPGSQGLLLSGRDGGAGEEAGAAWGLQFEGGGGGEWGHLVGAAEVSVMKLPEQLLVLHGQTLVDLGLLLQGLLQHGLLRGQLPAGHQHRQMRAAEKLMSTT